MPTVAASGRAQQLLQHIRLARVDSEVLLRWRGSIPSDAFEVIDEDGAVLRSELPRDSDVSNLYPRDSDGSKKRAASSHEPSPATTVAAIPAATPARLPANFPVAASSQQFAATLARLPADVPIAASSQQFAPLAIPSRAASSPPRLVAPLQAANLPLRRNLQPPVVSQPQANPPPFVLRERLLRHHRLSTPEHGCVPYRSCYLAVPM